MDHAGQDAAASRAALGAGGRIAGIAVGVDSSRVGVERSGGVRAGAVIPVRGGGDRRGTALGAVGVLVAAPGAGHRAEQYRGQDQGGETPRRGLSDALNGVHRMTIPFGQGSLLCRFLHNTLPEESPEEESHSPAYL